MFCIFDPFDKRHNPNIDGSDLRLIPNLKDRSGLPVEQPEKSRVENQNDKLVVLADINHVLTFRDLHRDGRIIVDTNEQRLKGTPKSAAELKTEIEAGSGRRLRVSQGHRRTARR